jgi:hypothetical protein
MKVMVTARGLTHPRFFYGEPLPLDFLRTEVWQRDREIQALDDYAKSLPPDSPIRYSLISERIDREDALVRNLVKTCYGLTDEEIGALPIEAVEDLCQKALMMSKES